MPPHGNSATRAARRMHPLRSDRRNTEGGCGQILWPACRLERCRAAIARPDLQQPHGPAGGGWMLAGLEELGALSSSVASSFETHRFAMLLRMRSETLMVRSAATPRVSNHQARWVPDCGSIQLENALEKTGPFRHHDGGRAKSAAISRRFAVQKANP